MALIVVALGGNALLQKGQKGTFEVQYNNALNAARVIADIISEGHNVVLTHGNGPQVGAIALQNEVAKEVVPPMPLHVCNAMSQALIGYVLQQALTNVFLEKGINKSVSPIITRVLVDKNDPAFQNPTKFIGPYYSEEEAKKLAEEKGWTFKKDPRGGYRRVVPSPDPKDILELEIIKDLIDKGHVVITVGGGGIPVIKEENKIVGVDAVIDKDLASSLLATKINADTLMILTDVEFVYLNYGRENQEPLREVSLQEIKEYYEMGHFPPGSMGPKVLAAIRFLENGGKRAIITHLNKARDALDGKTGTIIYP